MIVRPSTTITKAYVEQNAVEVLYKDTHMFITQNEKQIWIIDQIISDLNTKREVKLKTGFICFRLLLPVLSWDRRNPRSLVPKCHGSRWKQTDVATADPIAVQGEPFFWHSIFVRTNLWLRPQVLTTISLRVLLFSHQASRLSITFRPYFFKAFRSFIWKKAKDKHGYGSKLGSPKRPM